MQRIKRLVLAAIAYIGAMALLSASLGHAQALWKYTDKNGKVTYSDKAPKKGEAAQLVNNDSSANIMDAPKPALQDVPQRSPEVKSREGGREKNSRNLLQEALDAAKVELETAKTALEDGRAPLQDEVQIVVGRGQTGAPAGTNALIRKPEYYARISALEEAVKKAGERVEAAERDVRRGTP